MKKYLRVIILIIFVSVFSVLVYQITKKIDHKNKVTLTIKTIPIFSYQDINGNVFTRENLKLETATIFIYFNTNCEFCNEEAQIIKRNIATLSKVQLIFVSFEESPLITKFAKRNRLLNYKNIHFLHDSKVSFATTFDVHSLPCIVLYDEKNILIEKITGLTSIKTIIKKINPEQNHDDI